MFGYAWLILATFDYVWPCLVMFGYVWAVYGHMWLWLAMFNPLGTGHSTVNFPWRSPDGSRMLMQRFYAVSHLAAVCGRQAARLCFEPCDARHLRPEVE